MPVNHSVDVNRPLVYTVFNGDVGEADFVEHLRSLSGDPLYDASMPELVDLRDVTSVSVSPDMIGTSARWPLHSVFARRAVVAPTDLLFGLSRMYQAYRGEVGDTQFRVFRSLAPALEWLGLTEAPDPPAPKSSS